jgi:nitrogen fixation NifU-like protein
MSEPLFDDLYREMLLEHYRRPRNRGRLAAPTHQAAGMNPVCGDEVSIELRLEGDAVKDVAFEGQGCSISQASASMLSERVSGTDASEAREVQAAFEARLLNGAPPSSLLGDLEAFEGVAKFPVRVKCALLPWKVLAQGLEQPLANGGTHA